MTEIKYIILTIFLTISLLCLSGVLAATASDTATVDVTVATTTAIELNTTAESFSSVNPMANSSTTGIKVTNVGSSDVNNVYAYTNSITLETSNPRGSGTSTNWAATTFLAIENTTD